MVIWFCLRVLTIPDSGIVVASRRDHDNCQNGLNVKGWVFTHDRIKKVLFLKIVVSPFFQSVLGRNPSLIACRIRYVSIIVGLNQKPGLV